MSVLVGPSRPRVLLAGVSTRAAAESAVRAGFAVTSLDAYADLDQPASVDARSLPRDFGQRFTPAAAARLASGIECDAVAYLSSFENHLRAVTALVRGRELWGNTPDLLRVARDPVAVSAAFSRRGFVVPRVRLMSDAQRGHTGTAGEQGWLSKPRASGGGHGVRLWRGGWSPRRYLQERIPGEPYSVVFVAAGGRAVTLGLSRQLVGDAAFGAHGYRYCGNILLGAAAFEDPDTRRLAERASALAAAAASAFGLVGVNGVDVIAAGSEPVPIEVNPRWSASMELVERAHAASVFGAHAQACRFGRLPGFDFALAASAAPAVGKAIVFARTDVTMGDTRRWLDDDTVRDVPHPGEHIARGQPVCTVFATGDSVEECYRALVARADSVYRELAAQDLAVNSATT